ncbi:hypothetical protein F4777DRAFT_571284 [Nemania sp. FL0916]|nr:hypothetical protein F4777DRAFT_571284 [Nemania sp. FL0916]
MAQRGPARRRGICGTGIEYSWHYWKIAKDLCLYCEIFSGDELMDITADNCPLAGQRPDYRRASVKDAWDDEDTWDDEDDEDSDDEDSDDDEEGGARVR